VSDRPTTTAHRRTRRDHATETAEDYVEAVADLVDGGGQCRAPDLLLMDEPTTALDVTVEAGIVRLVKDLSARFGVSHVTVIRTLRRLAGEGLVVAEPSRPVELTGRGRRLARACRRRHDIVYRFLLAIGVEPRVASIDSEGIEHHVSPQTLERFREIADADAGAPVPKADA